MSRRTDTGDTLNDEISDRPPRIHEEEDEPGTEFHLAAVQQTTRLLNESRTQQPQQRQHYSPPQDHRSRNANAAVTTMIQDRAATAIRKLNQSNSAAASSSSSAHSIWGAGAVPSATSSSSALSTTYTFSAATNLPPSSSPTLPPASSLSSSQSAAIPLAGSNNGGLPRRSSGSSPSGGTTTKRILVLPPAPGMLPAASAAPSLGGREQSAAKRAAPTFLASFSSSFAYVHNDAVDPITPSPQQLRKEKRSSLQSGDRVSNAFNQNNAPGHGVISLNERTPPLNAAQPMSKRSRDTSAASAAVTSTSASTAAAAIAGAASTSTTSSFSKPRVRHGSRDGPKLTDPETERLLAIQPPYQPAQPQQQQRATSSSTTTAGASTTAVTAASNSTSSISPKTSTSTNHRRIHDSSLPQQQQHQQLAQNTTGNTVAATTTTSQPIQPTKNELQLGSVAPSPVHHQHTIDPSSTAISAGVTAPSMLSVKSPTNAAATTTSLASTKVISPTTKVVGVGSIGKGDPNSTSNTTTAASSTTTTPAEPVKLAPITRLKFNWLFLILTVIQVSVCCAMVWYIGDRNARRIVNTLSSQLRSEILVKVQNEIMALLIACLESVDEMYQVIETVPGLQGLLNTETSITPFNISYLYPPAALLARYASIPQIGFLTPRNVIVTGRRPQLIAGYLAAAQHTSSNSPIECPIGNDGSNGCFYQSNSLYNSLVSDANEQHEYVLQEDIDFTRFPNVPQMAGVNYSVPWPFNRLEYEKMKDPSFQSGDWVPFHGEVDFNQELNGPITSAMLRQYTDTKYAQAMASRTNFSAPLPINSTTIIFPPATIAKDYRQRETYTDAVTLNGTLGWTRTFLALNNQVVVAAVKAKMNASVSSGVSYVAFAVMYYSSMNSLILANLKASFKATESTSTPNAEVFIFERSGLLVATTLSDLDVTSQAGGSGRLNILTTTHPFVSSMRDRLIDGGLVVSNEGGSNTSVLSPVNIRLANSAAYRAYDRIILDESFSYGGSRWHLRSAPISSTVGLRWFVVVATLDSDFDAGFSANSSTTGWFSAMVGLLSILLTLIVVQMLTRPLLKLVSFMEDVSWRLLLSKDDPQKQNTDLQELRTIWQKSIEQPGGMIQGNVDEELANLRRQRRKAMKRHLAQEKQQQLLQQQLGKRRRASRMSGESGAGSGVEMTGAGSGAVSGRLSRASGESPSRSRLSTSNAHSNSVGGNHDFSESNSSDDGTRRHRNMPTTGAVGQGTMTGAGGVGTPSTQQRHHSSPSCFSSCLRRIRRLFCSFPKFLLRHLPSISFQETQLLHRTFGSMLTGLQASHEMLQTANESKRRFIRYIFHEVRVPFNAIVLGVEQLREDLYTEPLRPVEEMQDVVNILNEQSKVVARILNDVLSLQKIEDGALQLEYQPFNMIELVCGTLRSFQPLLAEKNLILMTEMENIDQAIYRYRLKKQRMWLRKVKKDRLAQQASQSQLQTLLAGSSSNLEKKEHAIDIHHTTSLPTTSLSTVITPPTVDPLLPPGGYSYQNAYEDSKELQRFAESCSREVLGDRYRLRQVLANFLSNSVKFTPSSGTVVVKVECKFPEEDDEIGNNGGNGGEEELDDVEEEEMRPLVVAPTVPAPTLDFGDERGAVYNRSQLAHLLSLAQIDEKQDNTLPISGLAVQYPISTASVTVQQQQQQQQQQQHPSLQHLPSHLRGASATLGLTPSTATTTATTDSFPLSAISPTNVSGGFSNVMFPASPQTQQTMTGSSQSNLLNVGTMKSSSMSNMSNSTLSGAGYPKHSPNSSLTDGTDMLTPLPVMNAATFSSPTIPSSVLPPHPHPPPLPPHWSPPKYVRMRVTVSDTGRGLSGTELQQMFLPYVQFQSGEQQQGKGTGLGLNISKSLIELHGGQIGVESEGIVGKGCSFFFEVPFEIVPISVSQSKVNSPASTMKTAVGGGTSGGAAVGSVSTVLTNTPGHQPSALVIHDLNGSNGGSGYDSGSSASHIARSHSTSHGVTSTHSLSHTPYLPNLIASPNVMGQTRNITSAAAIAAATTLAQQQQQQQANQQNGSNLTSGSNGTGGETAGNTPATDNRLRFWHSPRSPAGGGRYINNSQLPPTHNNTTNSTHTSPTARQRVITSVDEHGNYIELIPDRISANSTSSHSSHSHSSHVQHVLNGNGSGPNTPLLMVRTTNLQQQQQPQSAGGGLPRGSVDSTGALSSSTSTGGMTTSASFTGIIPKEHSIQSNLQYMSQLTFLNELALQGHAMNTGGAVNAGGGTTAGQSGAAATRVSPLQQYRTHVLSQQVLPYGVGYSSRTLPLPVPAVPAGSASQTSSNSATMNDAERIGLETQMMQQHVRGNGGGVNGQNTNTACTNNNSRMITTTTATPTSSPLPSNQGIPNFPTGSSPPLADLTALPLAASYSYSHPSQQHDPQHQQQQHQQQQQQQPIDTDPNIFPTSPFNNVMQRDNSPAPIMTQQQQQQHDLSMMMHSVQEVYSPAPMNTTLVPAASSSSSSSLMTSTRQHYRSHSRQSSATVFPPLHTTQHQQPQQQHTPSYSPSSYNNSSSAHQQPGTASGASPNSDTLLSPSGGSSSNSGFHTSTAAAQPGSTPPSTYNTPQLPLGSITSTTTTASNTANSSAVPSPATTASASSSLATATTTASTVPVKPKILVVEDSIPNRKLLMMLLRALKYESTGVENGLLAVQEFDPSLIDVDALDHAMATGRKTFGTGEFGNKGCEYGIILIDGNMPVLDGIKATRAIRSLGWNIPIVAVTGNALTEDELTFLNAGASAVLTKPVQRAALEKTLQQFLPGFQATQSVAQQKINEAKQRGS